MNRISINDQISYIEASDDPLSADIGIIRTAGGVWLYDVGNGAENVAWLTEEYRIVLSHFHADHTGNIDRLRAEHIYGSGETCRHNRRGTVISEDTCFGEIHLFPLPSSHARGCLGLEVGERYAFVGDALYSRVRDGFYVYNAQLLREEIAVLGALKAPYLLVSHYKGMLRRKEEVLEELNAIYASRDKNTAEIRVPRRAD